MSKAALKGHASGSGIVTLEAPNTNTDRTLVLPDRSGKLQTEGPAFSAYQTGSGTTVPENALTKIFFDTEEYDTDGAYDPVTSRFAPQVPGIYRISGNIANGVSASTLYATIVKNGAEVKRGTQAAQHLAIVSADVYLNGSDYVELWLYQSSGAARNTINAAGLYTYFQAHFVRSV